MNNLNHYETDAYRTDLFFELSADLFFIAGFDGYLKKVNPAVCKLFGYTEEEMCSRPIDDFIHENDLEITRKRRDCIRMGIPCLDFENRYVTKNGEIIWLSWTSMPKEDDGLVYAVAKNITHIKKQEEERNILFANLNKFNKELKKLTYTASHDMRSPVNNLLALYGLLDESKIEDEEILEYIQMLKMVTEGLKQTLNTYVDHISHNTNINIAIETLSFENSIATVLQSIKSLVQNSQTEFFFDFSKAATVSFNKTYLESIFLNLITNAIKYASPNRPPVISISTQKKNGNTQLIFSDNGQGFDINKVRDKIFGLNQKFHSHADSKGIGLYLVHNHITDMGGQIDVESEIDKGTTFILSFKE